VVRSPRDGFVHQIATERIGVAAVALGAGRQKTNDKIDPQAGIEVMIKLGQRVEKNQPLFTVSAAPERPLDTVERELIAAVTLGTAPISTPALIAEVLT
jgi:pyrimidine-nucleoside phosphorylase